MIHWFLKLLWLMVMRKLHLLTEKESLRRAQGLLANNEFREAVVGVGMASLLVRLDDIVTEASTRQEKEERVS